MDHPTRIKIHESLKDKKILALSDTGYPYPYIRDFCSVIKDSNIDIYVSPATTSRFLKVYITYSGNNKVKILKDKNFSLFKKIKPEDYIVIIFFGQKISKETKLLTILAQQLVVSGYNIITVNQDGVDYDEDNPIFTRH